MFSWIYACFTLDSLLAANCVFACSFLTSTNQAIKLCAVARVCRKQAMRLAMADKPLANPLFK